MAIIHIKSNKLSGIYVYRNVLHTRIISHSKAQFSHLLSVRHILFSLWHLQGIYCHFVAQNRQNVLIITQLKWNFEVAMYLDEDTSTTRMIHSFNVFHGVIIVWILMLISTLVVIRVIYKFITQDIQFGNFPNW